ncbi:hypothetical protein BDV38DRAFT_286410 [Aspergillus pseudotamarii]|uniref:Uncharacterized protein n=1 Tax=Aspergillus pseudotamarii TaxID=132259 RepID=A0A5N6SIR9_ASPPS|nr:uncharacterized protein BDV38DRAFT_286410 [Aspergillus pseudotamarii]KAE8133789.1 hypothetical protein BDV38DRAFT_286410 [Aspergillus pseudotamarii]
MVWRELIILEAECSARRIIQDPTVDPTSRTGWLPFQNNKDQVIESLIKQGNELRVERSAYDDNEWLKWCVKRCSWLSFVLRYDLELLGRSFLLQWDRPWATAYFYPFFDTLLHEERRASECAAHTTRLSTQIGGVREAEYSGEAHYWGRGGTSEVPSTSRARGRGRPRNTDRVTGPEGSTNQPQQRLDPNQPSTSGLQRQKRKSVLEESKDSGQPQSKRPGGMNSSWSSMPVQIAYQIAKMNTGAT